MRTPAIALTLGLALSTCGKQDKPADSPERDRAPAAETPAETQPAPAPAPGAGVESDVKTMTPDQVRDEVNRAGAEHADKIDEAMDVE